MTLRIAVAGVADSAPDGAQPVLAEAGVGVDPSDPLLEQIKCCRGPGRLRAGGALVLARRDIVRGGGILNLSIFFVGGIGVAGWAARDRNLKNQFLNVT